MMRFFTFLLFGLVLIQPASAWWNEDWAYRKSITIDTAAAGLDPASAQQEFTVLLRLHSGNFGYFFDIKEGGADLRFTAADDQTPLKYHVEKLDPINGMALIWVKLPVLGDASTSTIYMYYGNPAATPAADAGGTYGVTDVGVYHFDGKGIPQDVTAYGNHPSSFTAEHNTGSFIGSGAQFSGSAVMLLDNTPSLVLQSEPGWTFSSWFKPDSSPEQAVIFEMSDGAASLGLHQQGLNLVATVAVDGQVIEARAASPMVQGQWQHIGLSLQADQMVVYLQGEELARTTVPALSITGNISVGAALDGSAGLVGELDEVRLANSGHTAGWFKAIVAGQGQQDLLLTYGGDESQESQGSAEGEGGHSGYFGIIISSVFDNEEAIVEQIVIGFCGLMALVSFLVMFFKALFLFSAKSASKKFLAAYNQLGIEDAGSDLTSLRQLEKTYSGSPLFRVYAQGIDELQRRVSPSVGSSFSGLEPKSLNSIRASLDAAMIREGQRLNSQMVLLTIAISGGPFVGLLGTVVGVMVTFAGIAASGQVDINSIAPGMAAALLATVAGLGVAIPALFGYNYLGSHVKEISADMHVFADELIARIGESYGR